MSAISRATDQAFLREVLLESPLLVPSEPPLMTCRKSERGPRGVDGQPGAARRCSATVARYAPLSSEDRVDRLARPFALDHLGLDQVRLLAHAEPLEHAHRRRVARLDAGADAVQPVRAEREFDDRLGRLGRVAMTLVVGMEHETDLALPVLADGDVHGADQ